MAGREAKTDMKTFPIELKNAEDVVKLVNVASEFEYDIQLKSGDMLVDAKSIMGAMAMTEMPALELVVCTDRCDQEILALAEHLQPGDCQRKPEQE